MRKIPHVLDTEGGAHRVIIAALRAWIGSKLNPNGKCRFREFILLNFGRDLLNLLANSAADNYSGV
jgi:hypothetical protein